MKRIKYIILCSIIIFITFFSVKIFYTGLVEDLTSSVFQTMDETILQQKRNLEQKLQDDLLYLEGIAEMLKYNVSFLEYAYNEKKK